MGLEIAKIQNGVLQGIANQADENKDGVIRGASELNVFEEAVKNAVNEELVSKEDFKSTLDLFEIEYPSENQVLRNLAIESDEDKSEKLSGKELDNYIEKGKQAVNSELATEEELENTTDGFYQKKTTMQKVGRGLLIAGGAIVTGVLGFFASKSLLKLMNKKIYKNLENKVISFIDKGEYPNIIKTNFAKAPKRGDSYLYKDMKLTNLGYVCELGAFLGTPVACATAGGIAVAKATESNR